MANNHNSNLKLTAKDFEGAPETMEPDGIYQVIKVNGEWWFRNIETGEITP